MSTTGTLPTTQLGVLTTKDNSTLQEFPVPTPGPAEVLIENVAVASNPKDWIVPSRLDNYASIEGNDVAGLIVAVGEGVTEYKGGERVAAFSKTRTRDDKYGAYAQYTVAPATTTFLIPKEVSFAEASTLPLAIMTAALGLFVRLGLPEPPPPSSSTFIPDNSSIGVIINGASSSVGSFAVQLAKRAGFFVIGIAGSSCAYAESLDADVVIDYRGYRGEGVLEGALVTTAKSNGVSVAHAFDIVSENGSSVMLAKVLTKTSATGKGKVTYVLSLTPDEEKQIPGGVTTERTSAGTAHGEDEDFAARFFRQISQYLVPSSTNKIPLFPNQVRIMPEGLADVEKGLAMLKRGEVHAEKLVYRINDTPGLSGPKEGNEPEGV